MNKTFLIGRLTHDPELRTNDKGINITKFTLAVNRMKEGADFINCSAFNKTAEAINKYLHKGNQIAIEGRIQTGSYEKDGKKVYTTEVVVENITFIGNNEPIKEETKEEKTKDAFEEFADENEIVLGDNDMPF